MILTAGYIIGSLQDSSASDCGATGVSFSRSGVRVQFAFLSQGWLLAAAGFAG